MKGTLGQETLRRLPELLQGSGNSENGIQASQNTTILCGKSVFFENQYPFSKWKQEKVEKAKPGNILESIRLS